MEWAAAIIGVDVLAEIKPGMLREDSFVASAGGRRIMSKGGSGERPPVQKAIASRAPIPDSPRADAEWVDGSNNQKASWRREGEERKLLFSKTTNV
jgi:hypothetical protein